MRDLIAKIRHAWEILMRLNDRDLMIYSASLSFHTITAIIPILFISFSIFTKLPIFSEYYADISNRIFDSLLPSQVQAITQYINTFLANTTQMGIVGLTAALVISMLFFQTYEGIFMRIMHTPPRSFWQSLSSYWTLITLAPILLGASVYLSRVIQDFLAQYDMAVAVNVIAVLPYLVVWIVFFTMYMISSSAKISIKAGIISSFAASLVWNITKFLFVYYVTYSKTNISIYGSVSVVLFFIVWVYCSWIIFLYGARACYILNRGEIPEAESQDWDEPRTPSRRRKSQK
jgi:membrane protein